MTITKRFEDQMTRAQITEIENEGWKHISTKPLLVFQTSTVGVNSGAVVEYGFSHF